MDQDVAVGQAVSPVEPPVGGVLKPPPNLNDPNGPLAVGAQQFFHDLNPAPALKTAFDAAMHGQDPITAAVVNPIIAQSAQRLAAARTALAQGDHSTAALHFLGTVPVVGPIADDLLSAVRAGDTTKGAKALGDLAALAGPGLVSGGAETAGEAAMAGKGASVADAAQAGAESRIANTLDPSNNWGRGKKNIQAAREADKVAPTVLDAGPLTASRAGLRDFVGQQFQAASDAWDAAEQARQGGRVVDVKPIIAQLQSKIDALTSSPIEGSLPQRAEVTTTSNVLGPDGKPVQTTSQVPQPIGEAVSDPNVAKQIGVLQDAIGRLQKLGGPNGIASFESLRTMRQGADVGSAYKEAIGATSDANTAAKQLALGNRGVAGAIRDTLATADPKLAQANADFSMWQKANDVAQAASDLDRVQTKGGNLSTTMRLMGPLMGMGGGYMLGGGEGSMLGAAGGLLGAAMDAARTGGFTTKVATARVLSNLASAIRDGNAANIARSMAALASVTGTVVPAVNQSLAGGSAPVTIPQDPINVNLAANRGGGS